MVYFVFCPCRQAALKAASTVPVLNKEPMRAALQPRPKYPNVYDSQSQAKQASGELNYKLCIQK